MTHEISNSNLIIEDSNENFETIYQKEYFAKELLDEIKNANVLLIPNHVITNNVDEYLFPETTHDFFEFIKDNKTEGLVADIAVDDVGFKRLEMHSAAVIVTSFVVKDIFLPVMIGIVSSFLYEKVKEMHRKNEDLSANVSIIVTEKNGKKSKQISYTGPVSGIKDALDSASKGLFKNDK